MKVKCLEVSVRQWLGELGGLGYTMETQLDVTVGKTYIVYAMCLWREAVLYLLVPAHGRPSWYPAVFFDVENDRIPSSWRFAFWGREGTYQIKAVWGYVELVEIDTHFDALAELEPTAVQIFSERRGPIEIESEL